VKLFLICYALIGTHANTGAFMIHHLVEVGKTTYKSVIGVGGTITISAQALGHRGKLSSLEPRLLDGNLDIATLAHMTIIGIKGDISKYPRHK